MGSCGIEEELLNTRWSAGIDILLMVQKSGVHQFSLVVHPMIYRALYIQVVQDFFQQQYYNGIFANCRIRYIFGAWLDYGVNVHVELLFLKKTDEFHGCMKYPCGQIRSSFGFQSLQRVFLWLWKRSQKKTSFFPPKKKKLHMWLFPIWPQLLNKSCSINLHHLGHSHCRGIQKIHLSNPVRWHIPGSYFRSIGWCHPWCILRSWRVRVGSRHQGRRLWYQPYVP